MCLIYIGNGQYYDRATGKFLTHDMKANNSNPYVPWDSTYALFSPLGLLVIVFRSRKKCPEREL
jgi:hypothetical protein